MVGGGGGGGTDRSVEKNIERVLFPTYDVLFFEVKARDHNLGYELNF